MKKKHFIALADKIREFNADETNIPIDGAVIAMLSEFCEEQNPQFNRGRWLGYIAGENGPNGGAVKS
jgi:hypothetical protein